MSFVLRSATDQDWPEILSLATAVDPGEAAANGEWLAGRQKFDTTRYVRKHYLESDQSGHAVGYGSVEQGPGVLHYRMFLVLQPGLTGSGAWELLFAALLKDLQELKASKVWAREYSHGHYAESINFYLANAFRETHRVNTRSRSGADVVIVRLEREL